MSFEIVNSFVQSYKASFMHLSQQKGSRFESCVRTDSDMDGANRYFERVGATAAQIKQSRHSDTPLISVPYSRRRVSSITIHTADLIDNDDRFKLIIDPDSATQQAQVMAMGRSKDDVIIAGMLGAAFSGSDGQTSVAFPSGQVIADTAITNDNTLDTGSDDGGHMSPQRLRAIALKMDLADVDPDEERFIAVSPVQIKTDMLKHVGVTSADYNTVKALAQGAVDTFMGYKFIQSNRLPTVAGTPDGLGNLYPSLGTDTTADRICIAWVRSGVGYVKPEDVTVKMSERSDKNYAKQIYVEMVTGATRIEEAKVIRVPCKET